MTAGLSPESSSPSLREFHSQASFSISVGGGDRTYFLGLPSCSTRSFVSSARGIVRSKHSLRTFFSARHYAPGT